MALQGSARCGKDWQAWNGQVDPEGRARRGRARARHGTAGAARRGRAWNCTAAQARQGAASEAWPGAAGEAWRCQASSGVAGEAAMDGPGSDWQAWRGPVWLRVVLQARCGEARRDRGTAWQAWPERQRLVAQGRHGSVGRDWPRRTGKARRELVRRGVAGVTWLDGARHPKA